jgi:hypothetical protein
MKRQLRIRREFAVISELHDIAVVDARRTVAASFRLKRLSASSLGTSSVHTSARTGNRYCSPPIAPKS